MAKSKIKGMENLDFMKSLPKDKKKEKSTVMTNKTDRISYQNYLTHQSAGSRPANQKWKKILGSSKDK